MATIKTRANNLSRSLARLRDNTDHVGVHAWREIRLLPCLRTRADIDRSMEGMDRYDFDHLVGNLSGRLR